MQRLKNFTIATLPILLWMASYSMGYGQSYAKFIEPGKVWKTSYWDGIGSGYFEGGGNGHCGPYYPIDWYFIADDTIINGVSYSKMKIKPMVYTYGNCDLHPSTSSSIFAFLREDTLTQKVFCAFRRNGIWKEGLFLDFSLTKGDSVLYSNFNSNYPNTFLFYPGPYPVGNGDTTYFLIVDTVITFTLSTGKLSRKIVFKTTNIYDPPNYWIEGIGGTINPSGNFTIGVGEFGYFNDNSPTINNKVVNGELVLGLESDSDPDPKESLIPDDFTQVDIYDAQGSHITTIYDKQTFAGFCASLPTGMLVLRTTSRHSVSVKKVVFNR